MQIGIPAEIRAAETRVAATPETVKKLAGTGHHGLLVQSGAGDPLFDPGHRIRGRRRHDRAKCGRSVWQSDIVLKVRGPDRANFLCSSPAAS